MARQFAANLGRDVATGIRRLPLSPAIVAEQVDRIYRSRLNTSASVSHIPASANSLIATAPRRATARMLASAGKARLKLPSGLPKLGVPTRAAIAALPPRLVRAVRESDKAAPVALCVALFLAFPTQVGFQDMTSLVTGAEASTRWSAVLEKSAAGSVQNVNLAFGGRVANGIDGAGFEVPGIGKVALMGKSARERTPDEARVVRADKRDRLVKVVPVAPPRAFTAGSVFERTSSLMRPAFDTGERLVFAKDRLQGQEVKIASTFYANVPTGERVKDTGGVPSYLADLVNNTSGDVLATAYAPATPDYAKASPFESLLNDGPEMGGRFVPPVAQGDHSWLGTPLPASVFSASEQQCLANAVYFEARGESTRGQAAVAQVVLNRVRNPTYPNSICGVVYQNDSWFNRCQFSFACDGKRDIVTDRVHYRKAQDIAMAVTAGKIFIPEVGSSTHYYAQYVSPGWARAMQKMTKIGLHIFYRTRNGGWG